MCRQSAGRSPWDCVFRTTSYARQVAYAQQGQGDDLPGLILQRSELPRPWSHGHRSRTLATPDDEGRVETGREMTRADAAPGRHAALRQDLASGLPARLWTRKAKPRPRGSCARGLSCLQTREISRNAPSATGQSGTGPLPGQAVKRALVPRKRGLGGR